MNHYKIQKLSEADINRLEKASSKGAATAKEIRGLLKDIEKAGDTDMEELLELYAEMDGSLYAIFEDEVGAKNKPEPAKKSGSKERAAGDKNDRIQRMVDSWNKNNWAKSQVGNDDTAFFRATKIKEEEVGTASFTGNDIVFYDISKVEPGTGGMVAIKSSATKKATASKAKKPLRGHVKAMSENKAKRESLLARTENRADLMHLSESEVLAIARQYNDLRVNVKRDENTASKQRVSPTPENLIRWMRNPGGFDLVGIDSSRATTPTANLKMDVGSWFNRFVHNKKD